MPENANNGLLHRARAAIRETWRMLRQLSGDDAYERYVEHCRRHHPDRPLPGRREFHSARLAGKWSGVARCC